MSDFIANNLGLSVDEVSAQIRTQLRPIQHQQNVSLRDSLGRVLAREVVSPINVPAHDNSAMDGYAFAATLFAGNAGQNVMQRLSIIGQAFAGKPFNGRVGQGECVQITTGAVMPKGCDSVVPKEFTHSVSTTEIEFKTAQIQAGENRRACGEDLKQGSVALAQGRIITPADMGLLASLGVAQVQVYGRLKVAIFSTGDELRDVHQTLDAGQIYDSNRYTLIGLLGRLGCEVLDMGQVADNPAALEMALQQAAQQADVIITSGGVSVGEADYTKQVMAKMGTVDFWKIAMRPGRPMAFGHVRANEKTAYLFGLPGNPVAVMVTFYFFARAALLHLMGAQATPIPMLQARCTQELRKKAGRTEYQRGILARDEKGEWTVRITGNQGSGVLSSMSQANCMVVLRHEQGDVAAGELVDVVLFDGLV